uniref:AAA ATPase AAA+ lid domain-containing protein n=1 Tax=Fagus sylvatica TaxID=28930 RepID=A0A2N9J7G5_FAGSY
MDQYDAHSGGEREIQRTMLELLNQLDGFDSRGDVKVILATNRIESLDPALLRPGRIDRKIEFPLPDIKTRRRIFQIHTSRMTLADDVNLEEFVMTKDEFSGADIKAICTEAGLLALRERRMKVTHADFKKAKEKVMFKKKEGVPEGLYIFLHEMVWVAVGYLEFGRFGRSSPNLELNGANDTLPGLRPHEVSFLRLIEKSYDD